MRQEFLVGADISMLGKIEEFGGVFRQEERPSDPVRIFTNSGCNCLRLRLFVKPNYREGVVNDLPYTLALARRIKAAGARLLLDIHYSDTWADPAHQITPAAWADLDLPALEARVESYTADVLTEFRNQKVVPDIVQVGNEVTPGMLWPTGRLGREAEGSPDEQWERFVKLLNAGIRGVKKPLSREDAVRIMIHIDRGGDWRGTKWFFDNLTKREVTFDLIGQSYYPWWHGTLDDVRNNLRETAKTYNKDIVVVETAYPHRNTDRWMREKNMAWPITPEGQEQFLKELAEVVRGTPGGRGVGVLYWYPEALPVSGMQIWHGGATALFDEKGNVLPGLKALGKG